MTAFGFISTHLELFFGWLLSVGMYV